ncbi:MAG: sigma factor [Bryobacterales bacterium]
MSERPDAQDLTQEALIKALRRRDQLKDPEKAAHWIGRIATNTALDFVRSRKRVVFEEIEKAPRPRSRAPKRTCCAARKAQVHRGRPAPALRP